MVEQSQIAFYFLFKFYKQTTAVAWSLGATSLLQMPQTGAWGPKQQIECLTEGQGRRRCIFIAKPYPFLRGELYYM